MTVTEPESLPSGVDVETPNLARVYDYLLGGKDNFAADRAAAELSLSAVPQMRSIALQNRRFLSRAVRFCADAGIRQFVDIGAGLPTQDNVHQVAQHAAADSHVVYVDNDGVVVSHGLALLAENRRTTVIEADLRRPDELLALPGLRALIDLDQPVALLLVAILHFIRDEDDPAGSVATLRDALAPGSYLVISHAEFSPEHASGTETRSAETRTLDGMYRRATGPARTRAEVAAFFGDFEIVEPGLTEVWKWRPDDESVINTSHVLTMVGGVARKG
jgi:O-methyltransferase involved in polyketide biosynthesis